MYNLITDPLVRASGHDGCVYCFSLPELYVQLASDTIASFPALRPHQRHPWHALLCQLGALACLRSGLAAPPADAEGWRTALRALTPEFPDDEPWMLVTSPGKPAFLQAAAEAGLGAFSSRATADALDLLVTAKNHDVKSARLLDGEPDDWLFALIALQTSEGYFGARNYGISRMNGGFANRPGFSVAPPGGIGAHVMRDLSRLIAMREDILEKHSIFVEDGLALIWLKSWDGESSLPPQELDPYYIEICRRIRLVWRDDRLAAMAAGSKVARIAFGKEMNGLTGDPWTPIETKDGKAKALTIDARGFSYERLSKILFENGFEQAPLQKIGAGDPLDCFYLLICRALARGQGKTEGLHERRLIIPPRVAGIYRSGDLEPLAMASQQRIDQAGLVRKALRFGLMTLFQNGPEDFKRRDPSSEHRAAAFLDAFEADVDRDFFERLFSEIEAEGEAARREIRAAWLADLRERAFAILKNSETGSPSSTVRRYRAWVRAEGAFLGAFYKDFRDPYFPKDPSHVPA